MNSKTETLWSIVADVKYFYKSHGLDCCTNDAIVIAKYIMGGKK
jgi:hypothetical protein